MAIKFYNIFPLSSSRLCDSCGYCICCMSQTTAVLLYAILITTTKKLEHGEKENKEKISSNL